MRKNFIYLPQEIEFIDGSFQINIFGQKPISNYSNQNSIDYISICSPNHLHDSHIRFTFRSEADAICEKPLVLNPWNIDALNKIEQSTADNWISENQSLLIVIGLSFVLLLSLLDDISNVIGRSKC